MKIQWSAFFTFLALTTLVSCGAEQFGTAAKSTSSGADPLKQYSQYSCTSSTYIKPKVDILYVVDNSGSIFDIKDAVKTAIKNTAAVVSQNNYDFRLISTKLINPSNNNSDYLVYTNSSDELPDNGRKVPTAESLFNFVYDGMAMESGLSRTYDFMRANTNASTKSLFRKSAHQIVVLISNGQDDVAASNPGLFTQVRDNLRLLKAELTAPQFRFLSVTKRGTCSGKDAGSTYVEMSRQLYGYQDVYDICSSDLSTLFTDSRSSITDLVVPHKYSFWPITFAKSGDTENSFGTIKVYQVTPDSAPVEMTSGWSYHYSAQGFEDTRVFPNAGERVYGNHFIKFNSPVSYPNCIQIAATSRTEYFGYIVIPRKPIASSIIVKINGAQLPASAWSYSESYLTYPVNIKMPHPNAGDELPAVMKSGYMIKLNGSSNYYKSGDSVQVDYTPSAI